MTKKEDKHEKNWFKNKNEPMQIVGIIAQVFIAVIMLIAAIVSVCQIRLTNNQIGISNDQMAISKETLKQQYEFNKMVLRPYVMVEDIDSKAKIIQKNNEFKFTVNVRNYGNTPAYSVAYNGYIYVEEISLDSAIIRFNKDMPKNDTRIYIPQDKRIPFPSNHSLKSFRSDIIEYWKLNNLYEYIHIKYYDEMGNEYNFVSAWTIRLEEMNDTIGIIKVQYLRAKSF